MYGNITNCYSTCLVNATGNDIGGLIRTSINPGGYGSTLNCFWNVETSDISDGVGDQDPDPNGVTGLTIAQMMIQNTFTDAGWDYTDDDRNSADWMLLREGEDYPRLAWQEIYTGDVGLSDLAAQDDSAREQE